MSHPQQVGRYTPDEYYRLEAHADHRSEFYDGEIFAMAGGTPVTAKSARISSATLETSSTARHASPFGSDLKLRVKASGLRTYPDVSVYCGKREPDPDDPARQMFMNPSLLVDVLSPSTEQYDHVRLKFLRPVTRTSSGSTRRNKGGGGTIGLQA